MDKEENQNSSCTVHKMLSFFVKRSFREIKHRLCYFLISLGACFLAIFVALIANTIITQAPLMLLKIAEIEEGQIDIMIEPKLVIKEDNIPLTVQRYLNLTRIDQLTGHDIGLLAPRLIFKNVNASAKGIRGSKQDRKMQLRLMALDSDREKNHKIGLKYEVPELKEGECAIHESLGEYLKINKGDKFSISIEIESYLNILHFVYNGTAANLTSTTISCTVGSIFSNLGGKLPIDEDDGYIWMELNSFLAHLSKELKFNDKDFNKFLSKFNPYNIVSMVLANHPNRQEVYSSSNYYQIQNEIAKHMSKLSAYLGFFPIDAKMPVLDTLISFRMGAVFLSIILNLVTILLAAVSAFLIYSLLMISVETRMFELGMLRMLGIG